MKPETLKGKFLKVRDQPALYPAEPEAMKVLKLLHLEDEIVLVEGWFVRVIGDHYKQCSDWDGPYENEEAALAKVCGRVC